MSDSKCLPAIRTLPILSPIVPMLFLEGIESSSDFQLFQPITKLLGTVPSTPITIGIVFMFHNIFSSLGRSKYISLFVI